MKNLRFSCFMSFDVFVLLEMYQLQKYIKVGFKTSAMHGNKSA